MMRINVQARPSILNVCWRRARVAMLLATVLALSLIGARSAGAQTFTVLHRFNGQAGGTQPVGGVVVGALGNLYGVTEYGGSFNFGILFRLNPNLRETVPHSFSGGDGLYPAAPLIWGPNGSLYGTTVDGGTPEGGGCRHGCGTVFTVDKTGKETVLYAFQGGTDGGNPAARLVWDHNGNLYGTTFSGGDLSCYVGGCGVVFKLDRTGKQTVLYSFADLTDGKMPVGLVLDNAGNLYGTTYDGGNFGHGAVFKLDQTGTLTVLYSFTAGSDSADPSGLFFRDPSGNLYGTTNGVGSPDYGIVFKLDMTGKLGVLHTFTGGTDGEYPGNLISDNTGNLYGTTMGGGTGSGCYYGGCGTVFKVDTNSNETVLHDFTGTDGQLPNGLIMDGAGNLYGTTFGGGGGKGFSCSYYLGCGTVFKLIP
jgi:uncharacterized repeat protein (TIGR03803 family)